MKFLSLIALTLISSSVFAAEGGLTSNQAREQVLSAAHRYIARNAPDFGGSVKSPCNETLSGDSYTITCSGIANETIGGDGSVAEHFSCTGNFTQGESGVFYRDGQINCR
jgi:hypothetical protein